MAECFFFEPMPDTVVSMIKKEKKIRQLLRLADLTLSKMYSLGYQEQQENTNPQLKINSTMTLY